MSSIEKMLTTDENREHRAYGDPLTHGEPYTIGIGHTGPEVHAGLVWDDNQIDFAFQLDVASAWQGCMDHFPWFADLDPVRQATLQAMCFQMGITRLLKFHDTLVHMADGDYASAADSMRASLWARQTSFRAIREARQMQTGAWDAYYTKD